MASNENWYYIQVIPFEIDCAIFYTNLHELFCQFISWTNWVNYGKFMDNCWISCQVMADMKKVYDDLIIINLYCCMQYVLHFSHRFTKLQGLIMRLIWEFSSVLLPSRCKTWRHTAGSSMAKCHSVNQYWNKIWWI